MTGRRLTLITQENTDHQKAALKAENKKVLDTVNDHFTANKDSKSLVVRVPISANSKAISEAIKTISSKNKDKTVYLIAADANEGKVAHGCHVSEVRSHHSHYSSHQTNIASQPGCQGQGCRRSQVVEHCCRRSRWQGRWQGRHQLRPGHSDRQGRRGPRARQEIPRGAGSVGLSVPIQYVKMLCIWLGYETIMAFVRKRALSPFEWMAVWEVYLMCISPLPCVYQ